MKQDIKEMCDADKRILALRMRKLEIGKNFRVQELTDLYEDWEINAPILI